MSENYKYQYDLDGFPIARAQDLANRMKYHKVKSIKTCPACKKNPCLNKPNHRCVDCMLDNYLNNTSITQFVEVVEIGN